MTEIIRQLAPDDPPERAYGMAAAMAMEHLGHLFSFLDQRIGELVIFDPAAKVQENTIKDALKVGAIVCRQFATEGKGQGFDPAVMRDLWLRLVEESLEAKARAEAESRPRPGQ